LIDLEELIKRLVAYRSQTNDIVLKDLLSAVLYLLSQDNHTKEGVPVEST